MKISSDRAGLKFVPSAWPANSAPLSKKRLSRAVADWSKRNPCLSLAYANGFRAVKPFSVNLYGSHPDECNDDCWTGDDFATLDEARVAAVNWDRHFNAASTSGTTHVEILQRVGDATYEQLSVTQVRSDREIARMRRRNAADDRAWQREIAMQAGMGMGIDAYNEAMGWD